MKKSKKAHCNMAVLFGLSSLFCEDFNPLCFVAISGRSMPIECATP